MSTAAVVLAAGGSSRYGRSQNKLLAGFRGRCLVQWSVDAASAAGLDELVVVQGAVDLSAILPEGATVLHNSSWAEGQATSLGVALDWCGRQGHTSAVVGLGDQPLLLAEAWKAVAESQDRPIAVATYKGARRNPVRLHCSVWPLVDVSGDEGARALMARRPDLVAEVACEGEPADIDTVEELRRWS